LAPDPFSSFGETSTLTPQLNSEGNIVFDTTSTGLTGTRSGSQTTTDVRSVYEIYNGTVQTSGNLYSLTDSGESPPGGGPSINYLLPSTDFADDPPPEQNASLSTGGLGYFASAFGFKGGIVGASFATALPGDPTLPGSTNFGELDFGGGSWMQEPDPNDPPGTVYIDNNMVDDVLSISVVAPPSRSKSVDFLETYLEINMQYNAGFMKGFLEDGLMGDVEMIRSIGDAGANYARFMMTTTPLERKIMMAEYAAAAVEMSPEVAEFMSMMYKLQNGQFDSMTEGEWEKFDLFKEIASELIEIVQEELGSLAPAELVGRIAGYLAYEITLSAIMTGIGTLASNAAGGITVLSARMTMIVRKLTDMGGAALKIADALENGTLAAKISRGLKAPVSEVSEKGGLNLFKFNSAQALKAKGWKEGDYFLHLPNQGTAKRNWAQNSSRLREAMRSGKPIFDSYIDEAGNLIPTRGFLNAERWLLKNRGWTFNPTTGAWHPPISP
jgi:hypothetical protein